MKIKPGDVITISKAGLFYGMQAKVLEHNSDPDTIYKPLRIQVIDSGYTLSIEYHEIQGYKASNKPTETIKAENTTVVSSEKNEGVTMANLVKNINEAFPKEKRAYAKRGSKPKEVKEKRPYNRKKVD